MKGFFVASSLGALVKFDGIMIFYTLNGCLCQEVIVELLANINLNKHKWCGKAILQNQYAMGISVSRF